MRSETMPATHQRHRTHSIHPTQPRQHPDAALQLSTSTPAERRTSEGIHGGEAHGR
ncbi:hypothetical protein [Azospirillum brasilense]|uniref:hypothetical protein n=1 Tax=Azospirillum brasilense TaxID=192 RepID=UPI001EDBF3DF|nr:hypothetical protein [Azospirillum brasilense]UKJ74525.1 hypothetical protein H1Q64_18375 [Azospirillum brasilense]